MKKLYQLTLCIGLLCISSKSYTAVTLSGNSHIEGQTFTQSVGKVKKAGMSGALYVGAAQPGSESFSITRLFQGQTQFLPVISHNAIVRGEQITHPLFNQVIQSFDLFEAEFSLFSKKEAIIATPENTRNVIYFTEPVVAPDQNSVAKVEMTSSLRDANRVENAQVLQLVTDKVGRVFAAVAPDGQNFGAANSGIALVTRIVTTVGEGEEQEKVSIFDQLDAATGMLMQTPSALKLDGTDSFTAINANATLENAVDMYWDKTLQRLFIALQVTSGAGGKARALVVGRMDGAALKFENIIPDTAVDGTDQIIATGEENNSVSLHKVCVMHTSTGLSYVIVVGNNGLPEATMSNVFALPLLTTGDSTGKLAAKNSEVENHFATTGPRRFISRSFIEAAETEGKVARNNEPSAIVGRDTLPAGAITDCVVLNDTVFVTVGTGDTPGVYSSRALFAANGAIKGWTQWQRAAGTTDQIFAISPDLSDGSTILFSAMNANNVTTAKKTAWSNESKISTAINRLLFLDNGSSQQLFSFSEQPGVVDISLLAAVDADTLALINTGQRNIDNDVLEPTVNFDTIIRFENNQIGSNIDEVFALGVSGSVLSDIGPLSSVAIARNTDEDDTFIFVGGNNGIAVLAYANGAGINGQIVAGFDNNLNGIQMLPFGDFSRVRKLVADENLLYVLTDDQLIRININENVDITNEFTQTILVDRSDLGVNTTYGAFLDVIVSDRLAIIATTNGLFASSAATNVSIVQKASWDPIDLPECNGVPIGLTTAAPTNNDRDVARNTTEGGNVFVLCADRGNNRSRVYRIAIDMVDGQLRPVLFGDVLLQDAQTFFLSFGRHKNLFLSDGSRCFVGQNKYRDEHAQLGLLNQKYPPRVGAANIGNQCVAIDPQLSGPTEITAFTVETSAGAYVAAGDRGVSVHE